jgi:hypothetical protein
MKFVIGMCPEPVLDNSMSYQNRTRSISQGRDGDLHAITIMMCPIGSECREGLEVTIKMCPDGEECGCDYKASDVRWTSSQGCSLRVMWKNPDQCVLYRIELYRLSWWETLPIIEYTHLRAGSGASMPVYPENDSRNDQYCHSCGISGGHAVGLESVNLVANLIPGQKYIVSGYFHDQTCGGATVKHDIGYVLYQTTGFTSGYIISKVQDNPPKYNVRFNVKEDDEVNPREEALFTTDYTTYEVGDAVMLVKLGTNFPSPDHIYENAEVTSGNISIIDGSYDQSLFIAPFNKIED